MTESLSHFGPWTTADLAGLPDDGQRYEIIDGSLLVTPAPAPRHQLVAGRLSVFLREAAPAGADVVEGTNVQLNTGRLLVPDVIVAQSAALLTAAVALRPEDVHLVVEVVSPSNAAMDRVFKPQLYAAAGIGWMWRVELEPEGVQIVVVDLRSGSPVVHARSTDVLEVDAPFAVEIPVARLLASRAALWGDHSAADLQS
ncbi:Uma2 family endonuclease [Kribbella sp. NPDC059898]|uniref:Uma2 family endonuclease n=1 Tax=Kribbella sp. NPDC059898 TaxID=3346995 RepID=UPI00365E1297